MNLQESAVNEIERATCAMKDNRWADAVPDLRTAHEQAPNDFHIWGQLGFALSRNEQYTEAIQVFEEMSTKQPRDPRWPYMIGYQFYQEKDWARAIDRFDKALALRPGYVKALYRKGYAHKAAGQEEEAINALIDCISHWEAMTPAAQERDRPSYGKAQFQLGKIYLKKGRSFKARGHLQIAAQIDSKNHDVLYELGQCYLRLNQLDEAIRTLQEADQVKPGTDYILDRLAQAYAQKGEYAAAEGVYRRIPEHRRRPFVLQHLGMIHLKQGQHQKALSYLQIAAKKQPDNHNIHYALGSAQEATGQPRAAHMSYRRAVDCRKAKYNLEFKEAQAALERTTKMLATLPPPSLPKASKNNPGASDNNEGVIESYNESRGFGFIRSESQPRVFFHVSCVVGGKKPSQGLRVTFLSESSPKGPRAVHVKLAEN